MTSELLQNTYFIIIIVIRFGLVATEYYTYTVRCLYNIDRSSYTLCKRLYIWQINEVSSETVRVIDSTYSISGAVHVQ